jgi:hypothetical protein
MHLYAASSRERRSNERSECREAYSQVTSLRRIFCSRFSARAKPGVRSGVTYLTELRINVQDTSREFCRTIQATLAVPTTMATRVDSADASR